MRLPVTILAVLVVGALGGYSLARATEQAAPPTPLKETVNGITYHMPYGRPTRPFTPAVQAGNLIFVAGRLGTTAQGTLVAGGIQAETRQTLLNIKDVLEKSGSSMEHVVKCTVPLGRPAWRSTAESRSSASPWRRDFSRSGVSPHRFTAFAVADSPTSCSP